MFIEAIITAIIVSIDGFFTGVATGINKIKISINKLIIIGIIPIIMAIPIMLLGSYLKDYISSNISNYIGFTLFIILAIINLKENKKQININIYNCILMGITIGIDSSISAFSLSLSGHNPFITPLYFGIFHFIFILMGNRITYLYNIKFSNYISSLLFIIIAISKII